MANITKDKCALVVKKYIEDVLSGRILACKYVKLAINRHLNDLKYGAKRGLKFSEDRAFRVVDLISHLKQSKGKWAGSFLSLEPWQMFRFWVLFGWEKNGFRRFKTAYNEVARKNGKSTEASAVGLYALGFDGEGGAEIYSVATKEDQAKITFDEGKRMAAKSNNLGGLATVHIKSISIDSKESVWRPLGKDSKTTDGLNPHLVIVDEYHAHPDASMLEVMDSALGARSQPLLMIITTAGFNTECACKEERDYCVRVLEGVIEDDSYFGIIYTLDEGDKWDDESVWIKANPNIGVTVSLDDMKRMQKKASGSPTALNNFKTKKLNIWTNATAQWLDIDRWNACDKVVEIPTLLGRPCFTALDLSSNKDLTCWGLVFPEPNGDVIFIPRFFLPKDNLRERERRDRVPYGAWVEQGYIELTEGNVIDYEHVESCIVKDFKDYDVQLMAFDRWAFEARKQRFNAIGIADDKMVSFGQGFSSMTSPMKELERLVESRRFIHNNNPVLRWMASCTDAKTDGSDNIRPIKPDRYKSSKRIDGIVTAIMGIGIMMTKPIAKPSVYEERGLLAI